MTNMTPLLARQPIFDGNMRVIAYELLCRNNDLKFIASTDGDAASSQVLLNAFTELSIEQVVGKHKAFVNFTRTLLHSPPPFNRQKLVIEVLEGQQVDAAMLHALMELREQGYTIALDDFELDEDSKNLVPYADIIKLDVLSLTPEKLKHHIDYLKPFGITLIAEKVETYEMFENCKALGFDLFQGYFLAKPRVITGRKISENKQSVLQLLSALHDPDVPIEKIERMIARDTLLSFKLLRLVNSAAFGLSRDVESLRQAIMLLGLQKLRNWVNLLALSNLSGKPHELSVAALTRARMCEMIATHINQRSRPDSYFTVGLLSTLDAFLDSPLEELLRNLSLSETLNQAMLAHSGPEGMVLHIVQAHEQGHWDDIDWAHLESLGLSPETLATIYVDALHWVAETMNSLGLAGDA
ncbi:EAL and HDOD domain-containing protein [Cellvibrio sp. pealriver]|uniref:EAL and HDOD domain-containing protein n=1 Tax=Cellvibrio sp. pealriver TaxID=1622269 RepID=UPI00066FC99A|nr:HDOD domain-containing protein [Cellvibrio sp. pealriver]